METIEELLFLSHSFQGTAGANSKQQKYKCIPFKHRRYHTIESYVTRTIISS